MTDNDPMRTADLGAGYVLLGNRYFIQFSEPWHFLVPGDHMGEGEWLIIALYEADQPCCPCCNTVCEHIVEVVSIYLPHQLVIDKEPKLFSSVTEESFHKVDH